MNNEDYNQEQYLGESPELEPTVCVNCGNPNVEPGYEIALCKECRENLNKRPFPMLIKALGIIMVVIVIVALTQFPSSLKAGIAYEKGVRAEKDGKYVTAMKEYKIVTKKFPDSTLALARLFIATYNNGYINEASDIFDKIAGREPENDELVDEVNSTLDRMESIYYISDDLDKVIEEVQDADADKAVKLYQDYLESNPQDISAAYYYAYLLFDIEEYKEAKTVIENTLESNPDFYDGQLLLASIYRETSDYDKAIECCNKVIKHNSEYSYAYAELAKINLKDHQDEKGLKMALKAYELNKNDSSIVATLAIAYHYNNQIEERDKMVKTFNQFQDGNTYDLDLMNGIFSGDYQWRD